MVRFNLNLNGEEVIMAETIDQRLNALGIVLPEAQAPVANYVTVAQSGDQLFISGQLPLKEGALIATGKVGAGVDPQTAQEAAKYCAINILSQAKAVLGDLGKIRRIVKLTAFVAADPDFTAIPAVVNGASDFLVDVLGEAGKHARSAVGVAVLPLDAPVEIEAIIEIA